MITDDETKEMISSFNIDDLGNINIKEKEEKEEKEEYKTQGREYK